MDRNAFTGAGSPASCAALTNSYASQVPTLCPTMMYGTSIKRLPRIGSNARAASCGETWNFCQQNTRHSNCPYGNKKKFTSRSRLARPGSCTASISAPFLRHQSSSGDVGSRWLTLESFVYMSSALPAFGQAITLNLGLPVG